MNWKFLKSNPFAIRTCIKKYGLSYATSKVLLNRGIDESTLNFLINKPYELFENPHMIVGAEDAAKEIYRHLSQNKKFYVYADYDIDGMTAGFIAGDYLRMLGAKIEVIFPQRSDGYGINMNFCQKIVSSDKNSVIITVDNGISKVEEIEYLSRNKIPVVVTDHHEVGKRLPQCVICDPFLSKKSAGQHLCGAGVIWKVLNIVDKKLKIGLSDRYIPYVALGTLGDMMPLTSENLAIIKIGLERIREHKIHSLDILFREGIIGSSHVNRKNIIFGLNSMMNACSRLGEIEKASKLFFMENCDDDEIYQYGQEMKRMNELRKSESKKAVEYVLEHYAPKKDQKIIVADIGRAKAGLSGLVATNLVKMYNIPVCIHSQNSGKTVTASARSIDGLNILEYLEIQKQRGNIIDYGGHAFSCGIQLHNDPQKIKNFQLAMNELLKNAVVEKTEEILTVDSVLKCRDVNDRLRSEIDSLPYEPIFCLRNVEVEVEKPSKGKDHALYNFKDGTGNVSTIEWHGYPRYEKLGNPRRVDVLFSIEDFGISCYGRKSDDMNLRIIDIKKAG